MLHRGTDPLEGSQLPAKSQFLVNISVLQLRLPLDSQSWLTLSTQMWSSEPKAGAKGQGWAGTARVGLETHPRSQVVALELLPITVMPPRQP